MIEFTYDGMVRHGFGFFNPNHAAAFFCALAPWSFYFYARWRNRLGRTLAVLFFVAVTAAIACTFSRTGVLVLMFELLLYVSIRKKKVKVAAGLMLAAILLFAVIGVLARFRLDASIGNRFLIWAAGVEIFSINPLGVGFGNSGLIASAFLLDGIVCRTLVNSHLTMLVEWGIFVSIIYWTLIGYGIWRGGKKHPFVLLSFVGLLLSAWCASIFDWQVLLHPEAFAQYGVLNRFCLWILPMFFTGLLIVLLWGKPEWRKLFYSLAASILLLSSLLLIPSASPKIDGGIARKTGDDMPLLLYDNTWPIRDLLPFARQGFQIPLKSSQYAAQPPVPEAQSVIFFGESAAFSRHYPNAQQSFVDPPEFFTLPSVASELHLPRFSDKTTLKEQAAKKHIKVIFY